MDNKILDYYNNINKYSIDEAVKKSNEILDQLFQYGKETFPKEIEKFDEERNNYNKKLKLIHKKVIKELKDLSKKSEIKFKVTPASSFSANMNLPNESDMDFIISVKNLTDEDLYKLISYFSNYGYTYHETRRKDDVNNIHYVLHKMKDGIEIEIKIRDSDKTKSILEVHNKIDNKLDKNKKKILTYLKFIYKNKNQKLYNAFKSIFYTSMFNGIKNALIIK
jgi:hypothetical protein